jgi:hypothetical protein
MSKMLMCLPEYFLNVVNRFLKERKRPTQFFIFELACNVVLHGNFKFAHFELCINVCLCQKIDC